jgi:hypothetical protein
MFWANMYFPERPSSPICVVVDRQQYKKGTMCLVDTATATRNTVSWLISIRPEWYPDCPAANVSSRSSCVVLVG